MSKKISSSEIFEDWSNKVKSILNDVPERAIDGQQLEYKDDEFASAMRKLQQCSMNFENFPIYPINEQIANELKLDQLRGYDQRPEF